MASRVVTALLVFVVLMVGKAAVAVPRPPDDQCGPVCAIYCPYGNVLDEKGCPTCQCIEIVDLPPVKVCPPVCMMFCPYGNVLDSNGCPTCKCKQLAEGVCQDECSRYCANPSDTLPPGCACECRAAEDD